MKQGDTTNEAAYSAYRIAEFGTNSDIKFGDEVEDKAMNDGTWIHLHGSRRCPV